MSNGGYVAIVLDVPRMSSWSGRRLGRAASAIDGGLTVDRSAQQTQGIRSCERSVGVHIANAQWTDVAADGRSKGKQRIACNDRPCGRRERVSAARKRYAGHRSFLARSFDALVIEHGAVRRSTVLAPEFGVAGFVSVARDGVVAREGSAGHAGAGTVAGFVSVAHVAVRARSSRRLALA